MTITWGGIEFTGPHILSKCPTSNDSGLYSIMKKPDPISKPDTYTIIYFGESEDFSQRITSSHHKYDCWKKQAGSENGIYYGLNILPSSTEEKRREIESQLIEKYHPTCND